MENMELNAIAKKFGAHIVFGGSERYIVCEFDKPIILSQVFIQSGIINNEYLKDFNIYGSSDGKTGWNLIYSGQNECNYNLQMHDIENISSTSYKFLKLEIKSGYYSNVSLQEILYYGK